MAQLNLQYDNMNDAITRLKSLVEEFESTTTSMTTNVGTLCDNWQAEASPIYREDYTTLSSNFTKTTEVVKELIASTEKYLSDMNELDKGYATSKVTNA